MMTIETACHRADLDPLTGCGYLTRPLPEDDLMGLHGADWNAMIRLLAGHGWEPTEDEHGDVCPVGYSEDGREVIGLYGRDPIISSATVAQLSAAFADLGSRARLR